MSGCLIHDEIKEDIRGNMDTIIGITMNRVHICISNVDKQFLKKWNYCCNNFANLIPL